MKVVNKQDRQKLCEGRNFQMGFAFLKKKGKNSFETVQPVSPCKDYLNDIVWGEKFNKSITAYGLSYTPNGLFNDDDFAYILIGLLPQDRKIPMEEFKGENCSYYPNMSKDLKNLSNNYKKLEAFINFFDNSLNLKPSTINKVAENSYIVSFDKEWASWTYSISLFSLLLRVGQFWDGKRDCMEFLENFKEFTHDSYLVKGSLPKIKKLLKSKKFLEDSHLVEISKGYKTGSSAFHNWGICATSCLGN